jgi:hypothetical protein
MSLALFNNIVAFSGIAPKERGTSAAVAGEKHGISKSNVQHLENEMLKQPQAEIKTEHYFADGVYVREITIPKGVLLTGAVHLTETIDVLVSGDITIIYDEVKKRLQNHGVYISKPGVKKLAFAHEDTVWMTVHAVDDVKGKTLDEVEKELWVTSYDDYNLYLNNKEEALLLLNDKKKES